MMDRLLKYGETARRAVVTLAAVLAAVLAGVGAFRPGGTTPTPPVTIPPTEVPPGPKSLEVPPDPWNALTRIQFGNAGCTATVIGPRRADGRWDILSAAHCFGNGAREGTAVFRSGLSIKVQFERKDERSDVAWLTTTYPVQELPYALLADAIPQPGDKVYHGGYGVDRPGNRESGTVVVGDNGSGQTQYRISVSSGDSGGGIALDGNGRVLSPVCCTTAKGQVADVWGGTVTECRRLRPVPHPAQDEWTPIELPIRTLPVPMEKP